MAKIEVYKIKMYNVAAGDYIVSRRMATREGATRMKCVVIEDTGVEIDESELEPGENDCTPIDFAP